MAQAKTPKKVAKAARPKKAARKAPTRAPAKRAAPPPPAPPPVAPVVGPPTLAALRELQGLPPTPMSPPQPWQPPPPSSRMLPAAGPSRVMVMLLPSSIALSVLNLVGLAFISGWGRSGRTHLSDTLLNVLAFAVQIPLIIAFCIWLYRVLCNAKARHPLAGISPGWAVGSFFIPIVNFFAPYFVVRRAWEADVSPDAAPVAWWFVPWSLSGALGIVAGIGIAVISFSFFASTGAEEPLDIEAFYRALRPFQLVVETLSLALTATSAVFLVRLAHRWTPLQEGRPVS